MEKDNLETDNMEINNKYIIFSKKCIQYDCVNDKNYTILQWFEKHNLDINVNKNTNTNIDTNIGTNQNIILVNNHYITNINELLSNIFEKLQTSQITIDINPRLKGGGFFDIFKSIIQIGKVFLFFGDVIYWLLRFIGWFVFFIVWLLKFMLVDLLLDLCNSILVIVVMIFQIPIDIITAIIAFFMNAIGGWMTTIWGWDQSNLTKKDKESNYFRKMDRTKGKKCYLTNSNTVPFSILLGTIICPPIGVFMDMGLTGWFNILICILLTLMFYVPGLFYALIVIYS